MIEEEGGKGRTEGTCRGKKKAVQRGKMDKVSSAFVETSRWGNLFVRPIPSSKENILLVERGKCERSKGKNARKKKYFRVKGQEKLMVRKKSLFPTVQYYVIGQC